MFYMAAVLGAKPDLGSLRVGQGGHGEVRGHESGRPWHQLCRWNILNCWRSWLCWQSREVVWDNMCIVATAAQCTVLWPPSTRDVIGFQGPGSPVSGPTTGPDHIREGSQRSRSVPPAKTRPRKVRKWEQTRKLFCWRGGRAVKRLCDIYSKKALTICRV